MSTTTLERPHAAGMTDGGHGRLRSLWRGRPQDPAWFRPLLLLLLAATAGAYLIDLTVSNDANSFYAAAVQAGTRSWKAFFFGSIDASNFITVDKPPAFLWVMDLSGRIFGFSSASMLAPEVLEGVISVGLLACAVKRWYGAGAGLLAGALLALTPVAALMFRFNNPDALMVCLVVASAYCLVRSLEGASTRWLLGVGACLGFAFLAKMMEAFLVVPGFALVYLIAAPTTVRRRVTQLIGAGVVMFISAGWWVAIVELWPASSRPMIDGSPSNSILNLIFDYNGLGRLTGNESGTAGAGGGGGGANFSGGTGITRLFNDSMGAQASWMIPAAMVVLVAGLIWSGRRPRTDRFRAGLLVFGTWLVVTAIVFSFSAGTIHTYYTVALAPPIAALTAIGAVELWRRRESFIARGLLALMVALTAGWSVALLSRDSSWESWLTPLVIVTGIIAILALLAPVRFWSRAAVVVAVVAAIACLAAPVAYTADTITTAHTGSTPTAGPASAGGFGGGGGFGARGFGGGTAGRTGGAAARTGGSDTTARSFGGATASRTGGGGAGGFGGGATTTNSALAKLLEASTGYRWAAATDGSQSAASLELASNGSPVMAIGGFSGLGGNITLSAFEKDVKAGEIHYYVAGTGGGGFGGFGGAGTAATGAAGSDSSSSESGLSSLFGESSSTTGATSGTAPTGGTSGTPPTGATTGGAPTGTGRTGTAGGVSRTAGGFGGRSSGTSSTILAWVKAHYHSSTVGGETVYDLSDPLS